MTKQINKAIATLLSLVISIATINLLASCSKQKSVIEVWTATSAEKIMRDVDYSSRYDDKTLTIKVFKNEYESGQIFVSDGGSNEYQIETADLKTADGKVLPASAFTLYHQRYINVEVKRATLSNLPAGYTPDALVPYEKAKEYGDTAIPVGQKNQGITVTVHPSKEQAAGIYVGEFTVKVGDNALKVPITVQVYDYALSDETHIKTLFGNWAQEIGIMELDTTTEIYEAYYEYFLDYRVCLNSFPSMYKFNDDNKEVYYKYLLKYATDKRVSTVYFPEIDFNNTQTPSELDSEGLIAVGEDRGKVGNTATMIKTLDWVAMEEAVDCLIKLCFSNNINLFEKMVFRTNLFDEFDLATGYLGINRAVYNSRRINDILSKTAEIIDAFTWTANGIKVNKEILAGDDDNAGICYTVTDVATDEYYIPADGMTEEDFNELKEKMSEDILEMTGVTTSTYFSLAEIISDNTRMSFCPRISVFDGAKTREQLQKYHDKVNAETWIYTCGLPSTPYPTYHIDDLILSSRLLGWMMYDYNVVGNLYWSTSLSRYDGSLPPTSQLIRQDIYQEPNRDNSANGDGFLTYPGKPYGIKGPIGSLRLNSLRDGNEDYDLMYELEQQYKEKRGVTESGFDSVVEFLTSGLYSGATCDYSDGYVDLFYEKRDLLASLLEACGNAGIVVESYEKDGTTGIFTVTAPESVEMTFNGKAITETTKDNGINKYIIETDLTNDDLKFVLKGEKDGRSYTLNFEAKGAKEMTVGEMQTNLSLDPSGEATISGEEYPKYLFDTEDSTEKDGIKYVQCELNVEFAEIDKKSKHLKIEYYYSGNDNTTLVLQTKNDTGAFISYDEYSVKQGWNELDVDLTSVGISVVGTLEKIRFRFVVEQEVEWSSEVWFTLGETVLYR